MLRVDSVGLCGGCREADTRRRGRRRASRRHRRRRAESRDRRSRLRASSRPLATQLSATPPARTRFFMPVCSSTWRADPKHGLFGDDLDAGGQIHVPLFEGRLGLAGRPTKKLMESSVRHRQALAVVEVAHVEPEAAVRLQIDQVLEDLVAVNRLAVGSQAHQLVFAAVDLEAAIVGERRIQEAQASGEMRCDRSAGCDSPRQRQKRPWSTHRRRPRSRSRPGRTGWGKTRWRRGSRDDR